jgi:hypothetical protein
MGSPGIYLMVTPGKFFLHSIPIPAITSSSSNINSLFETLRRPIGVIVSPPSKHAGEPGFAVNV